MTQSQSFVAAHKEILCFTSGKFGFILQCLDRNTEHVMCLLVEMYWTKTQHPVYGDIERWILVENKFARYEQIATGKTQMINTVLRHINHWLG